MEKGTIRLLPEAVTAPPLPDRVQRLFDTVLLLPGVIGPRIAAVRIVEQVQRVTRRYVGREATKRASARQADLQINHLKIGRSRRVGIGGGEGLGQTAAAVRCYGDSTGRSLAWEPSSSQQLPTAVSPAVALRQSVDVLGAAECQLRR